MPDIKQSTRTRERASLAILSGSLLCAVLLVSYWTLSLVPRSVDLFSLRRTGDDFHSLKGEILEVSLRKGRLEKEIALGATEIKPGPDSTNRYEAFLGQAKSAGLEIGTLEEIQKTPGGKYQTQSIGLKVKGEFQSLRTFLNYLESSSEPIAITSLKISTPDGVSALLECELGVTIYGDKDVSK